MTVRGDPDLVQELSAWERALWTVLARVGVQVEVVSRHDAARDLLCLDIRVRWDPVILVDPPE